MWSRPSGVAGCYQSQHYKIWKQFTTHVILFLSLVVLLSITKLQNLKAIHNEDTNGNGTVGLLSIIKLQNLKAIHNISMAETFCTLVVINHKTTKFESNSQPCIAAILPDCSCYQSQNYKIWKQFTTKFAYFLVCFGCYQSQNYKIWKQFTTRLWGRF